MRFLARDAVTYQEAFPVAPLIEEAYQEARKHQPAKTAQLKCDTGGKPIVVTGDRAALKHASPKSSSTRCRPIPATRRLASASRPMRAPDQARCKSRCRTTAKAYARGHATRRRTVLHHRNVGLAWAWR